MRWFFIVSPTDVRNYLEGVRYPSQKDELVDWAMQKGASSEVVTALDRLPSRTYGSMKEVGQALVRAE